MELNRKKDQLISFLISVLVWFIVFSRVWIFIFLSFCGVFDLLFLWVFVSVSAGEVGLRMCVGENAGQPYESL
jgi:hypothetical protein